MVWEMPAGPIACRNSGTVLKEPSVINEDGRVILEADGVLTKQAEDASELDSKRRNDGPLYGHVVLHPYAMLRWLGREGSICFKGLY
jgi:hypothetical protein